MDALKSLNNFANNVDNLNQPTHSFVSRNIKTRALNLCVGVPLEVLAIAQNVAVAPFQAVGGVLKLAVKGLSYISKAALLNKLDQKLPSLRDFFCTTLRVIALAIGVFSSVVLGFVFSPAANFRLHEALGLVKNEKKELYKMAVQEEETRRLVQEIQRLQADKAKAAAAIDAEKSAANRLVQKDADAVLATAREVQATIVPATTKEVTETLKTLLTEAEDKVAAAKAQQATAQAAATAAAEAVKEVATAVKDAAAQAVQGAREEATKAEAAVSKAAGQVEGALETGADAAAKAAESAIEAARETVEAAVNSTAAKTETTVAETDKKVRSCCGKVLDAGKSVKNGITYSIGYVVWGVVGRVQQAVAKCTSLCKRTPKAETAAV